MKKILMVFLSLLLAAVLFAGCAGDKAPDDDSGNQPKPSGSVTIGLAVVSSIDSSADYADGKGLAQIDSNAVAVMVGSDGKIIKCVIDSVQTQVNFDQKGLITTPLDTLVLTKTERAEEYDMKKGSAIGKEWYEQAQALSNYVTGKTAAEIKGISLDQARRATDADLKSSVTMSIGGYVDAIVKAMENAKSAASAADDRLGLGIVTSIDNSVSAGESDGTVQADSIYAVITTGADGKITGCVLDGSQSNVTFGADGKITADKTAALQTKKELGNGYNLKKFSSIGKEWYEQADAFAAYIIGKTPSDISGIAINDDKKATSSDLTASVTISIGDFQAAVEKAAASTK